HARGRTPPHREAAKSASTGPVRIQVRVRRVAFWASVAGLGVLAGWTTVAATYMAFHDDLPRRLGKRQAEVQFSYEDQIAEMRARVDRATSRQMVDQEQLATKLEQLVRRQTILEGRANMLGTLSDPSGSAKPHNPAASAPATGAG